MSVQFDVFNHPVRAMRARYPYVIVLQHDSIAAFGNVVIAPLTPPLQELVSRVYPVLDLRGSPLMMLTPDLAVVTRRHLRRPVANLASQRDRIIAAIDKLFAGS